MNDETEKKDTEKESEQTAQADQSKQSDQRDNNNDIKGSEPEWVSELGTYPLREKDKDPKWAVRTVWIWIGFAMVSLVFILTMLILGAIYD